MGKHSLAWLALVLTCAGCSAPSPSGEVGATSDEVIFCSDTWDELEVNDFWPLSAVGLLDNGCTAFLIDSQHIAAAGHCFVAYDTDGSWQTTNMHFYLNFHPSRVAQNPATLPRASVERVVVGARLKTIDPTWDWGIAKIGPILDPPADITPINLADPADLFYPTSLVLPNYRRAYYKSGTPNNIYQVSQGGNMTWTGTSCGWAAVPGFPPVGEVPAWCNQRWSFGLVNYNCGVSNYDDGNWGGNVRHNCDTSGGASGAPLVAIPDWKVVGISHTGGATFETDPPAPCASNPDDRDLQNTAVSATRFLHAPRKASNVAVSRRVDGSASTGVYATDSDTQSVKYREKLNGKFTPWKQLGSPLEPDGVVTLGSIAACEQAPTNTVPRVFVAGVIPSFPVSFSRLYSRAAVVGPWLDFGLPPGVTTVADIDATEDLNGRCQIFVVGNGAIYTKRMISNSQWSSSWDLVAAVPTNGNYKRVTAIRDTANNYVWAAMLDGAKQAIPARFSGSTWTVYGALNFPGGVTAWTDIDFGRNQVGTPFLAASAGSATQWKRSVSSTPASWPNWTSVSTKLYNGTLVLPAPPGPAMATITATRFFEGVLEPGVFGTDDSGNVYLLHGETETKWRSFYSQWIEGKEP